MIQKRCIVRYLAPYSADKCGQLSKELAEPYYLYGKALLECARMESNVLGPGMLSERETPPYIVILSPALPLSRYIQQSLLSLQHLF